MQSTSESCETEQTLQKRDWDTIIDHDEWLDEALQLYEDVDLAYWYVVISSNCLNLKYCQ